MRRMCDSAGVPGDGTLIAARRDGVNAWAGYLASPYASHGWSPAELSRVLARIGELLPVYVAPYPRKSRPTRADFVAAVSHADPVGEAHHAVSELYAISGRALGVVPICLDIEAGVWTADPAGVLRYFGAFVHTVTTLNRNIVVVPYSSPSCLIGLGQHDRIPAVWAASWLGSPSWPTRIAPPGLGSAWAGHRAWQYHGDTRAYGADVDLSVVDDAFPFVRHHSAPARPAAPAPAPHPAPAPAAHPTASATVVVDGKTFRGNLTAG